jgi:hypothetical protein
MQLPADVEFHEDIGILIYRPVGSMNEAAVNKILNILSDLEATRKEPFNRFFDTTRQDEIELNFKYMIHVSLYRRLSYANRPAVKSAILATDSTMIHYGKLHRLLTQGSPIQVQIFQDRQDVAQWLNVPVERLTAKTEDKT